MWGKIVDGFYVQVPLVLLAKPQKGSGPQGEWWNEVGHGGPVNLLEGAQGEV